MKRDFVFHLAKLFMSLAYYTCVVVRNFMSLAYYTCVLRILYEICTPALGLNAQAGVYKQAAHLWLLYHFYLPYCVPGQQRYLDNWSSIRQTGLSKLVVHNKE